MSEYSSADVPRPVEVLLAFVNTRTDGSGGAERFGSARDFGGWLRANGPNAPGAEVSEADAAQARELREALITVMSAHTDAEATAHEALERAGGVLREVARRHPLVPLIGPDGVTFDATAKGDDVQKLFGSLVAAATELALTGRWQRVKACRNPLCRFGFYDRTRNGSGAFCGAGCRSQASMRAWRQRVRTG